MDLTPHAARASRSCSRGVCSGVCRQLKLAAEFNCTSVGVWENFY